ncbi:hypothetical protein EU528_00365 [Candidatus Thorarchaeota archaeon]|nr:MAG: hypothetical protein EU528_00365 [Candidatus Thorarchaeota archaeon]
MRNALLLIATLAFLIVASSIGTVGADEEHVAVRGQNITISVILLQNGSYGNPVPEQSIEFYDQTHNLLLGIDTTDVNGLASIDWNIPFDYSLGPTQINATFRGNESLFLVPSNQSFILNILASTEIVLQGVPLMLAPDDTLSFSVVLLDDTSNPINNRTLFVFSDDIFLATAVTNSTGDASFSIHCNSSWSILGENVIKIVHEQDIENYYERAETNFSIEIQKIQTSIQSNFSIDSILLDDSLDLEVMLTSIDGGISANLEVFLDGTPLTVATTDSLGNGTINIAINEQFSLSHHFLNIFYNGSERYSKTSCIIEFDVLSPAIIDIEISSPAAIGLDTNVTISLCDILGRPIETTLSVIDISNGRNMTIQVPHDTIDFNFKFTFLEPVGLHDFMIEIGNQFVINRTIMQNIVIWSQPELILIYSNTFNFASPNQELNFIVQLADWSRNISDQPMHLLCDGEIVTSVITNESGIAIITAFAPNYEGIYNFSVIYPMNLTRYELSTKLDYLLTVSTSIPVLVELDYYEIVPPLQRVTVYLQVTCLNGSLIEGIPIYVIWLSIENHALTQKDGLSVIHLPVPGISGNYTLYYAIEQTHNIASLTGSINISISLVDILTSQGIGINGFGLGILTSLTIVAIPLIRQKYLAV